MVRPDEKERLKREGKWDAFVNLRRKHSLNGADHREAQERAYAELMNEVPASVPVVAGSETGVGDSEMGPPEMEPQLDFEATVDWRKAVNWVVQALALPGVTAAQAPTLAAWSMYLWASRNRDEFFKGLGAKQMPSKVEDAGAALKDDGRKQIALAERLLRERELECANTPRGASENTARSA